MYLEYHRGTKTSVNEIKHYNRRAELWAYAAETLVSILNVHQPGIISFEKHALFEMWRKVLFNQFHDILPGSAIPDVYLLALQELKDAIGYAKDVVQRCLARMAPAREEVVVYNPFAWPRSEYCTFKNKLFFFDNLPGLSVQAVPLGKCEIDTSQWVPIRIEGGDYILENELMRVGVHKDHGTIATLFYKPTGTELLDPSQSYDKRGCGLRVFHDYTKKYRAWNIDRKYPKHRVPVAVSELPKIAWMTDQTPCITTTYAYLNSHATICVYLRPRDSLLHVSITTDNRDPVLLVKYFFPLSLKSNEVTAEIPYASIARKRVKVTEREKAKWEMNMQKWVDVSDATVGIAIVNNNRYGFNATAKGIYITLTRTAKHPLPKFHSAHLLIPPKDRPVYMDLKPFTYELGIMPHTGSWQESGVVQASYNFNFPLIIGNPKGRNSTEDKVNRELLRAPFIEIDSPEVILGTIKPSEWCGSKGDILLGDSDWYWNRTLIIRLVEQHGRACRVNLRFASHLVIAKIEEVDLLEMHPSHQFQIQENQISVSFTLFEIKTLRVWLS